MLELLQRPKLQPDEWWDSYGTRVLAENGHFPQSRVAMFKYEPLVDRLVSRDAQQDAQAGDSLGDGLRRYCNWRLPAWAVRGPWTAAAFCPACFAGRPHVRLSWRLQAVTHCELHSCALQARCHTCRRFVFHWDLARGRCRCGALLVDIGRPPELAPEVEVSSATRTSPIDRIVSAQDAELACMRARADGPGADIEALQTIVLLGKLIPRLSAVKLGKRGTLYTPPMNFAAGVRLGRGRIEGIFDALPSAIHLQAALRLVLQVAKGEERVPSILRGLPLRAWAERLCALGASPARAESLGLIEVGALKRRLVPLGAAAKQAGLTVSHVCSLLSRGEVSPTRTFEVGQQQRLFSADQVESLKRFRHQGSGYGKGLDLGVDSRSLDVLRQSRIVSLVPGAGGTSWLDGSELRSLLTALVARATPVLRTGNQMLSLSDGRIWQPHHVPGLKALFSKLMFGESPLWISGVRPGFACFYVGIDALEFLHRSACARTLPVSGGPQLELLLSGGRTEWEPVPADRPRSFLSQPRQSPGSQDAQLALELV